MQPASRANRAHRASTVPASVHRKRAEARRGGRATQSRRSEARRGEASAPHQLTPRGTSPVVPIVSTLEPGQPQPNKADTATSVSARRGAHQILALPVDRSPTHTRIHLDLAIQPASRRLSYSMSDKHDTSAMGRQRCARHSVRTVPVRALAHTKPCPDSQRNACTPPCLHVLVLMA